MGGMVSTCVEPGSTFVLFKAIRSSDPMTHGRLRMVDAHMLTYHAIGSRETLWHVAGSTGNVAALEALLACALDHGLQPEQVSTKLLDQRNDKGQTPLMLAAWCGQPEAVKWLRQQGADPGLVDRCGSRTALHYAVLRGCLRCITALLDSLPPQQALRHVDVRSIGGLTPLHYASATNQAAAARVLLQRGAGLLTGSLVADSYDLVTAAKRSTPLHMAALQGHSEVALVLLNHYYDSSDGASGTHDPRRRMDGRGRLPYQLALQRGDRLLAEVLHPASILEALFGSLGGAAGGSRQQQPAAEGAVGVPCLSRLASNALQQQLLLDIHQAEERIREFRQRDPVARDPKAAAQHEQPAAPATHQSPHHPACPPARAQLPAFAKASGGWVEGGGGDYSQQPLLPVVQCTICLDDDYCLAAERCHHRVCAKCARDITSRAPAMPLPCPMCRCHVAQWSAVLC